MPDAADSELAEGAMVARKRRKGLYILPNLVTLAALFAGFYSIVMAMNGRFDMAAIGVFCAMVLDSLDGRVARMTNTQSAFGEQMDSLSDMVSFGAAPALISYEWALRGLGRWGWIAAFVYCACAALRLARFNVNTGVVDKRYFQGLPSPAAAAILAGDFYPSTQVVSLVTKNIRDFGIRKLASQGIEVQRPDAFLLERCQEDPAAVASAFAALRATLRSAPTPASLLERLAADGQSLTAAALHEVGRQGAVRI